MNINLATIDFCPGGGSAELQEKTTEMLLSETTKDIYPDEGYDGISKVTVTHSPVEDNTDVIITENGTIVIAPSEGYDATVKVTANVNVPSVQDIDFSRCGYDETENENAVSNVNYWIDYTEEKKNAWDPASTSAIGVFYEDTKLIFLPKLTMTQVVNTQDMCRNCYSLKYVPSLSLPACTNISGMFYGNNYLEYIGNLDTPNLLQVGTVLYGCKNLKRIESLNFSSVVGVNALPNNWNSACSSVVYLRFTGSINVSIRFNNMISLDYDSIKSALTAMSNSTTTTTKDGIFNHTVTDRGGELAALVSACTAKGYVISGLNIN